MRTRKLLLMAALAVSGAATSMAAHQNAVGIVTKTIPANGFALISNPLIAADNRINALFSPAPSGFSVFKFDSGTGGFVIATFDDLDNIWLPPLATLEVGDAFFLSKLAAGSWDRIFDINQG